MSVNVGTRYSGIRVHEFQTKIPYRLDLHDPGPPGSPSKWMALPSPVPPLVRGFLGGLNGGDHTKAEISGIFLRNPKTLKNSNKNFPKKFRNSGEPLKNPVEILQTPQFYSPKQPVSKKFKGLNPF